MYSIGIDVGGSWTKFALLSARGRILYQGRMPARRRQPVGSVLEEVARLAREAAAAQGLPYPPPGGAGLGVAAIVNERSGWLKVSGGLELADCDLRGPAEAAFGCPVVVECDSNAGALADFYWGSAREAENLLYISWGTGVSAGLVLGRRLYHSAGHAMGEFGHTQIGTGERRACYCGCEDCLETAAGGWAIEQSVSEALGRTVLLPEIARLAAGGDPLCRAALERAARQMARGVAGVVVVLNPDHIVFGGGVSNCFSLMRPAFQEELVRSAPAFSRQNVQIGASEFPDSAGVIGAAMLPRHEGEPGWRQPRSD